MYSFFYRMLPKNLIPSYFKFGNTQHLYNIRSLASDGYYLEKAVTKSGQLTCSYTGVKI